MTILNTIRAVFGRHSDIEQAPEPDGAKECVNNDSGRGKDERIEFIIMVDPKTMLSVKDGS